jgi:hypothetical protein
MAPERDRLARAILRYKQARMRVFDGHLHVHYGQAYVFSDQVGDTADMEACFRGQSNGLLGAAHDGMLWLTTGLHTGFVEFSAELVAAEPRVENSWEECVEAAFAPNSRHVQLFDWDRTLMCEIPLSEEHYRVRYVARGMDLGHETDTVLAEEKPVDAYQLWFWPAGAAPDRVLKTTSEMGRYWHDWARNL